MGNANKAVRFFRKATELAPQSATSFVNLGNLLTNSGQVSEAIEVLTEAVAKEDASAAAEFHLGNAYMAAQEFDKAREHYEISIDLDPTPMEVYSNLGNALQHLQRHEEAFEIFKSAVSLHPTDARLMMNLGNALMNLERHTEAVQTYEKSLTADPVNPDAFANLATALFRVQRTKEAFVAFETAVSLHDQPSEHAVRTRMVYAQHLAEAGRQADALKQYEAAASMAHPSEELKLAIAAMRGGRVTPDSPAPAPPPAATATTRKAPRSNRGTPSPVDQKQATSSFAEMERALEADPTDPVLYCNYGRMLLQVRRNDDALVALQTFAALDDGSLGEELRKCHVSVTDAYFSLKMDREAMQAAVDGLALYPADYQLYYAIGRAARTLADHTTMQGAMRTAALLRPNDEVLLHWVAIAYTEGRSPEKAIPFYEATLQLNPLSQEAFLNMGNALHHVGRQDEAITALRTANALREDPLALATMAAAMRIMGREAEALQPLERSVQLNPDDGVNVLNLGASYIVLERYEDGLTHLENALKLGMTDNAPLWFNLGHAYSETGRTDDGIEAFERALQIQPDYTEALAQKVHLSRYMCDWDHSRVDEPRLESMVARRLQTNQPAGIQGLQSLSLPLGPDKVLDIAKQHALETERKASVMLDGHRFSFSVPKSKSRSRLTVALVSSNYGEHAITFLMTSYFRLVRRDRVHVHAVALNSDDGTGYRNGVIEAAETFFDASKMAVFQAAEYLNQQGIHVAVDLSGQTRGGLSELFAMRPCKVQVGYMGYLSTSGGKYLTHQLIDSVTVPPEHSGHFSERLGFFPSSFFYNSHRENHALENFSVTRATVGLPEGKFVFCHFNQLYKLDPDTFSAWMDILNRVPNSILWLQLFPRHAEANLRAHAQNRDIGADRLFFTGLLSHNSHVATKQLGDLFLDTPEYNAHSSGIDILYAGVPMLTLPRGKMVSRVAASLLVNAGLPELVSRTMEEYVEAAVHIAQSPDVHRALRSKLERHRSLPGGLFDTETRAVELTRGLQAAWDSTEVHAEPRHVAFGPGL